MNRQLLVGSLVLALASGGGFAAAGQARERSGGQAPRALASASGQSTGSHAVPRGGSPAPSGGSARATAPRGAPASAPSGARSAPRNGSPERATGATQRTYTGGYARPRDGRFVTGTAVPRGSVHPVPPIYVYPPSWGSPGWGWGSVGWWGLPGWGWGWGWPGWGWGWGWGWPGWGWGSVGWGLPGWGWGWGSPGWGWDPSSTSVYVTGSGYAGAYAGGVRLRVRPRDAQVFVDGYYVGIVDEFDGNFQQLRLEEGPHVIEVKKEGFAPLEFKVRVTFDHTIKLQGELTPLVPQP